MVLRCFGATKDLESFSPSLLKKAEAGDSEAQYLLGYNYLWGRGVAKNEQESIRWFILSANKGHPKSMNSLGAFFLKNKIDSPETDAEIAKATPEISFSKAKKDLNQPHHLQMALFWFMQAADAGNPRAKTNIGSMYWNGIGLEQNLTEASNGLVICIAVWQQRRDEGHYNDHCFI
jgi:TPR repeat protein